MNPEGRRVIGDYRHVATAEPNKNYEFRTGGTVHMVSAPHLCGAVERFRNEMVAAAHRLTPAQFCREFGVIVFETKQMCP